MPHIRILHASDLHVAVNARCYYAARGLQLSLYHRLGFTSHDPDAITAFTQFAIDCAQNNPVDVVVVSGDLAHCGTPHDLLAARDVVDNSGGTRAASEPALNVAGLPIVLLPGNHDRFRSYPYCRPGGSGFDAAFKSFWTAGQLGNGVQRLWEDTPIRGRANLVLIGADMTLTRGDSGGSPSGILGAGCFGRGKAYGRRISRLRQETQRARRDHPNCAIAWVIHFEPMCNDTFLKLLNEDAFLRAATAEKIPLILCGHSHRSSVRSIGQTMYSVCGTTGQYNALNGNHVHIIAFDVDPQSRQLRNLMFEIYQYDPSNPGPGFKLVSKN